MFCDGEMGRKFWRSDLGSRALMMVHRRVLGGMQEGLKVAAEPHAPAVPKSEGPCYPLPQHVSLK